MKWTFAALFLFFFAACRQEGKVGEGRVTYRIKYAAENPYRFKAALPSTTDLFFKNNKACFITSAGLGMIKLVNILDHPHAKYTSLLINNLGENLAFTYQDEEIKVLEETPELTFEETAQTKVIAGLVCNKAIVHDRTHNIVFDIYYYRKLKMNYASSPYKSFNYLLMEYPHTINGLPMQLSATAIDFSEVDTNLFTVQGEFKWVDNMRFFTYIDGLK